MRESHEYLMEHLKTIKPPSNLHVHQSISFRHHNIMNKIPHNKLKINSLQYMYKFFLCTNTTYLSLNYNNNIERLSMILNTRCFKNNKKKIVVGVDWGEFFKEIKD